MKSQSAIGERGRLGSPGLMVCPAPCIPFIPLSRSLISPLKQCIVSSAQVLPLYVYESYTSCDRYIHIHKPSPIITFIQIFRRHSHTASKHPLVFMA
jgi:hypothetical protein